MDEKINSFFRKRNAPPSQAPPIPDATEEADDSVPQPHTAAIKAEIDAFFRKKEVAPSPSGNATVFESHNAGLFALVVATAILGFFVPKQGAQTASKARDAAVAGLRKESSSAAGEAVSRAASTLSKEVPKQPLVPRDNIADALQTMNNIRDRSNMSYSEMRKSDAKQADSQLMKKHLIMLGLPLKEPSNAEVVSAYKMKAMECNPEQFDSNDPARATSEAKLKEIIISFRTLMQYNEHLSRQNALQDQSNSTSSGGDSISNSNIPKRTTLKDHLLLMGLPLRDPTNTEILDAYRMKSAEFNPELLKIDDPRRKIMDSKFAEINNSFKMLMQYKDAAHRQLVEKQQQKDAVVLSSDTPVTTKNKNSDDNSNPLM